MDHLGGERDAEDGAGQAGGGGPAGGPEHWPAPAPQNAAASEEQADPLMSLFDYSGASPPPFEDAGDGQQHAGAAEPRGTVAVARAGTGAAVNLGGMHDRRTSQPDHSRGPRRSSEDASWHPALDSLASQRPYEHNKRESCTDSSIPDSLDHRVHSFNPTRRTSSATTALHSGAQHPQLSALLSQNMRGSFTSAVGQQIRPPAPLQIPSPAGMPASIGQGGQGQGQQQGQQSMLLAGQNLGVTPGEGSAATQTGMRNPGLFQSQQQQQLAYGMATTGSVHDRTSDEGGSAMMSAGQQSQVAGGAGSGLLNSLLQAQGSRQPMPPLSPHETRPLGGASGYEALVAARMREQQNLQIERSLHQQRQQQRSSQGGGPGGLGLGVGMGMQQQSQTLQQQQQGQLLQSGYASQMHLQQQQQQGQLGLGQGGGLQGQDSDLFGNISGRPLSGMHGSNAAGRLAASDALLNAGRLPQYLGGGSGELQQRGSDPQAAGGGRAGGGYGALDEDDRRAQLSMFADYADPHPYASGGSRLGHSPTRLGVAAAVQASQQHRSSLSESLSLQQLMLSRQGTDAEGQAGGQLGRTSGMGGLAASGGLGGYGSGAGGMGEGGQGSQQQMSLLQHMQQQQQRSPRVLQTLHNLGMDLGMESLSPRPVQGLQGLSMEPSAPHQHPSLLQQQLQQQQGGSLGDQDRTTSQLLMLQQARHQQQQQQLGMQHSNTPPPPSPPPQHLRQQPQMLLHQGGMSRLQAGASLTLSGAPSAEEPLGALGEGGPMHGLQGIMSRQATWQEQQQRRMGGPGGEQRQHGSPFSLQGNEALHGLPPMAYQPDPPLQPGQGDLQHPALRTSMMGTGPSWQQQQAQQLAQRRGREDSPTGQQQGQGQGQDPRAPLPRLRRAKSRDGVGLDELDDDQQPVVKELPKMDPAAAAKAREDRLRKRKRPSISSPHAQLRQSVSGTSTDALGTLRTFPSGATTVSAGAATTVGASGGSSLLPALPPPPQPQSREGTTGGAAADAGQTRRRRTTSISGVAGGRAFPGGPDTRTLSDASDTDTMSKGGDSDEDDDDDGYDDQTYDTLGVTGGRRTSAMTGGAATTATTLGGTILTGGDVSDGAGGRRRCMTQEERMMRNREAAAKSRQRKDQYQQSLQKRIFDLQAHATALKSFMEQHGVKLPPELRQQQEQLGTGLPPPPPREPPKSRKGVGGRPRKHPPKDTAAVDSGRGSGRGRRRGSQSNVSGGAGLLPTDSGATEGAGAGNSGGGGGTAQGGEEGQGAGRPPRGRGKSIAPKEE